MKLLILTQKVDKKDPILGFFHDWIAELSKKFSEVSVICLEKGEFDLPQNVRVYSLGKESGGSKIKYVRNFMNLILGLHKQYDSVFIHMNQEYVLLGGFFWKIMGKKIFFWRNHPKGNFLTRIAVLLSDKVFYTSKYSYTAKFKKAVIMPVGIDTERFKDGKKERLKNSILFLSRMSPIKKPDLLIEALGILNKENTDFVCDFYGDPLPKDQDYYDLLKNKVREFRLENKVNFYKGVPNRETPGIYAKHSIFVNLTPAGSFDKTIFEAGACGCLLVVANQSLVGAIDERMILKKQKPEDVVDCISFWLGVSKTEKESASTKLQEYILKTHSLDLLVNKLAGVITAQF